MTTTRNRILEYLRLKGTASAVEMSRVFQKTPANIRHHLSVLSDQGNVNIVGKRQPEGRGRPTQIFSLTEQVQENNIGKLLEILLLEFILEDNEETQRANLKRVAERLAENYTQGGTNLSSRLFNCIGYINKYQYNARWEARAGNPHVIFEHCPYSTIISKHSELCQIDRYLLEVLLQSDIHQVEKLTTDKRGTTYCLFEIRK